MRSDWKENEAYKIGLCMLAGIAWLWVILRNQQFMYVLHDDVYIRDIASGAVSGTPDGHLIYMKYVLGAFLALLYRLVPQVDWYGTCLILISVLCFLLILHRCLQLKKPKGLILLFWMLGVVCMGLYNVVLFQYTVTAAISGGTGIFLLFTSSKKASGKQKIQLLTAGFLLAVTYLIRQETFLMVFPVALLFLAFRIWEERRQEYFIFLGALLLVLGVSGAVEKAAYSSEEWQEYLAYNKARTEVFDYYGVPAYEGNEAFYASIGMEEHEAVNLERYSTYLIEKLPGEKMNAVAAYAKEQYLAANPLRARAVSCIKKILFGLQEIENRPLNWLTGLMVVMTLALCIRNRSRRCFLCAALLLLEAAFWLYLGWQGRFYWRVGACLFLVCFLGMAAVVYRELEEGSPFLSGWKKNFLLIFACFLFCGVSVKQYQNVRETSEIQYNRDQNLAKLQEYCQERSENVYFSIVGLLYTYSESFSWTQDLEASNLILLGDWTAYAPVTEQQLANYGIEDVRQALVQQENVYLILNRPSGAITSSCQEFAENIQWIEADRIEFSDYELCVYQLRAVEEGENE